MKDTVLRAVASAFCHCESVRNHAGLLRLAVLYRNPLATARGTVPSVASVKNKRVKIIVGVLGGLLLLLLLPWGAYWIGMSNLDEFPLPPSQISITEVEKRNLWNQLREKGAINIQKQTPYEIAFSFFSGGEREMTNGKYVTSYIAKNFAREHLKDKRNFYAQLTIASLTVWITRNWTADQILQRANELHQT